MKFGLKAKIIISLFLLISIPITILGYLSYNKTADSLQQTIENSLREETRLTAETINLTIKSIQNEINIATNNSSLSRAIEYQDDSTINKAFIFLSEIQKQNKERVEMLALIDDKGKTMLTSESLHEKFDVSDRRYVKEALKGVTSISDVIYSKSSNNPVIAIAQPIKKGKKVQGALIATIRFETISSHIKETEVGEQGYAYMIDNKGLIISHPKEEKILKENILETSGEDLKLIVNKMIKGESGNGFYSYEGVYKYITYYPAGKWTVALTADYNKYMKPAFIIRRSTIIIGILSVLIAMILAYLVSTTKIINPIKSLQGAMMKAGEGDLDVEVHINTKDEIQYLGESFNKMILGQSKIIKEVRNAAKLLSASSEELAASSEEIGASTEEISASVNQVANNSDRESQSIVETSQALVQLSSLVQLAKNKAITSNDQASYTLETVDGGRQKVEDTVKAMEIINENTNNTENILKELNLISDKVSGITNMINSIAEETSLLSLNASIEAARAGEHGRGFTVVAEEVRKLSDQSSERANEINQLISEMLAQVNRAVGSIKKGKAAVVEGVQITNETDDAFIKIKEAINKVANNVKEIVDITQDEVATSDQIIKLIDSVASATDITKANSHEVASATQEQAAATETLAATAEETSKMAIELEGMVRHFKIRGE